MRGLRRARVPLAYSQGFHPRPSMAFSHAVPLGEESVGDYLDIELSERVDPAGLPALVNPVLPDGFEVLAAVEVPPKAPSLMALAQGGVYKLQLPGADPDAVRAAVDALLGAEALPSPRRTKSGARKGRRAVAEVDIRPMIRALRVEEGAAVPTVHVELGAIEGKPGKPGEVVARLPCDPARARVVRVESLARVGEGWVPLFEHPSARA